MLGTQIDALDWEHCVDRITEWATGRESRCVCMCNVHSIVTARREPAFKQIIDGADLALPDGAPIAWYLRRHGSPGQERINGPDLMWRCCIRAAERGLSVFLYGCRMETLRRLKAHLVREVPGIRIAGSHAPPFRRLTSAEDARIVRMIEVSGAQIVFVALGCPKQEAWAAAHRGRIRAVMIGVGAAFDYHAGTLRRAPLWMQNAGLEWLYRLVAEPGRLWRRYLVSNTLFCAYLLQGLLRSRGDRSRSW